MLSGEAPGPPGVGDDPLSERAVLFPSLPHTDRLDAVHHDERRPPWMRLHEGLNDGVEGRAFLVGIRKREHPAGELALQSSDDPLEPLFYLLALPAELLAHADHGGVAPLVHHEAGHDAAGQGTGEADLLSQRRLAGARRPADDHRLAGPHPAPEPRVEPGQPRGDRLRGILQAPEDCPRRFEKDRAGHGRGLHGPELFPELRVDIGWLRPVRLGPLRRPRARVCNVAQAGLLANDRHMMQDVRCRGHLVDEPGQVLGAAHRLQLATFEQLVGDGDEVRCHVAELERSDDGENLCVPILERMSGFKCGKEFKVGYSPERINPGDKEHTLARIVKVVAGDDAATLEAVAGLYGKVVTAGVHKASSIKVAEAAKVIENTQRDLNIALMNELALIFDRLGIRTHDVLEAAGTKWN